MAQPAAYVLMLGTLFAAMTGLPLAPCILAAAVLSLFYVDRGGLRTVVLTDQVQFVLMYAGFAVLLVFLVAQHGGPGFLRAHLPATHLTWHGGNSAAGHPRLVLHRPVGAGGPGLLAARLRRPRPAGGAQRGAVVGRVLGGVRLHDHDRRPLRAGAAAPAADPVFAFPELARITLPPFALGALLPGA